MRLRIVDQIGSIIAIAAGVWAATSLSLAAQTDPPSLPLGFEVATIKPSKAGSVGRIGFQILPGGDMTLEATTLKSLIAFAYDIMEDRVSGGPKWANTAIYDIVAKADRAAGPPQNQLMTVAPGMKAWNLTRLRTQTLLADRFGLVLRKNTKETSGYALVVAKGGSKLRPSADRQGNASTMRGQGSIDARRGTIAMLAAVLTNFLEHPVEDRTGLAETYDYKLEYGDDSQPDSIHEALQQQLGLKLERARIEVLSLVIEKASRPTPN